MYKEGREASHHLIEKIAKRPPISKPTEVNPSLPKYLRRQIFRRACNEIGLAQTVIVAAESEVNKFNISLWIDEHIFRFKTVILIFILSIYIAHGMEMFNGQ